jgi:hypothetical protein
MAQIIEVFLLLFVHKKKPSLSFPEGTIADIDTWLLELC